jgi:hypothetical protein
MQTDGLFIRGVFTPPNAFGTHVGQCQGIHSQQERKWHIGGLVDAVLEVETIEAVALRLNNRHQVDIYIPR